MSRLILPSERIEELRDPALPCAFRRSESVELSWGEFAVGVARLRAHVRPGPDRWLVCADDSFEFFVAFFALLREGKTILIPGGPQSGLVAEIGRGAGLLSDGIIEGAADIRALRAAQSRGVAGLPKGSSSIVFYTSGSTGQPKAIAKSLRQIEAELVNLGDLWADRMEGRRLYSSVSHQHIYGFLFHGILPLCLGVVFCSERLAFPESIAAFAECPAVFATSPAFLKRMAEAAPSSPGGEPPLVFSSGGVLPEATASSAFSILASPIHEIYGSSETGGIAWRPSGAGPASAWSIFPGIKLRLADDGRIELSSPYLPDGNFWRSDDLGALDDRGRLRLLGRADSVVKIEEKRVSLTEIEARLGESDLVAEARALALENEGRQFIAAAVMLSPEGRRVFARAGRRELCAALRSGLSPHFAELLMPRKWRFVESFPINEQGKLRKAELAALFERKSPPYSLESVSEGGGAAELLLRFSEDCPYFDGHFRAFKILPAVAQIDVVLRASAEHLGSPLRLRAIPRVKFQRAIKPKDLLRLRVEYDCAGTIGFSIAALSPDGEEPCSTGRLSVKERP